MTDWPYPNAATWASGFFTLFTGIVAAWISVSQGRGARKAAEQTNEARAWKQALLIEPLILHVWTKLDTLIEMHDAAVASATALDEHSIAQLSVGEIDELSAVIGDVDALDDPLRTDVLRLVAWGRALNLNIRRCIHGRRGHDNGQIWYQLDRSVAAPQLRAHIAELTRTAECCKAGVRDFITRRGAGQGVKSYIAAPKPTPAEPQSIGGRFLTFMKERILPRSRRR